MPLGMWNDVLCMGKRYKAEELATHGVVQALPPQQLFQGAMEVAKSLKAKGKDEKTRETRRKRGMKTSEDVKLDLRKRIQPGDI